MCHGALEFSLCAIWAQVEFLAPLAQSRMPLFDFFSLLGANPATPERKGEEPVEPDVPTPEKEAEVPTLRMKKMKKKKLKTSSSSKDEADTEEEEGERRSILRRRRRQKQKQKKKDKKKKKREKEEKKAKKWYPGRDKIPGDLSADGRDALFDFWMKHQEEWTAENPELQHIVSDKSEGNEKFNLGCEVCMAYFRAHPEDKSFKRCNLAKGEHAQVRKADLLRHVEGGPGTLHQKALAWKTADADADVIEEAEGKGPRRSTTLSM